MFFLNPFNILAKIFVRIIVKKFDLPTAFLTLFSSLATVTISLTRSIGFSNVFHVLVILRRAINSLPNGTARRPITASILMERVLELAPGVNLFVLRSIIDCIPTDVWASCLSFPKSLMNLFNYFLFPFLSVISIRPLLSWVTKTTVGLILSTFGILSNETLNSISWLRDFANYFLDILDSCSIIDRSQIIKGSIPDGGVPLEKSDTHSPHEGKTGSILTIIGLILIGVLASLGLILFAENYYPETVNNIPVVNTVADMCHIGWEYVKNFVTSLFSNHCGGGDSSTAGTTTAATAPAPTGVGVTAPESISRSSSGSSSSSDSTIRGPEFVNNWEL